MRIAMLFALILLGSLSLRAGLTTKTVEYAANGTTMKGYLAYEKHTDARRPGILVVHEWWGHNDYALKRAEMLAELGYVALAVDMYGEGKQANHPEDAGKFAGEVSKNIPLMRERFLAAFEVLKNDLHVDPKNIGAIGYCFGGAVVLNMARAGLDLKGVVSFHGSLGTSMPAEKGVVKARVLVCNGADDKFMTEEDIGNFKQEMESAGVNYQFRSYEKAIHSFTNPDATEIGKKFSLAVAYNEAADKASWKDMQDFFAALFER
jgi:dienelactone hydrolase